MHIPSSTYRIQIHNGFTFRDLQRILGYLQSLGITTLYASPITQATAGSMHGYDVTDPHKINEEIGSDEEFRSIAKELHKKDMHWLQDIVPNHMAFHTSNYRLMDVLERGPESPYYHYFDIDWDHPAPELKGKVMVPFLGNDLDTCLQNGEIKLSFTEFGFFITYFDTAYPLSLSAYPRLMAWLDKSGDENHISPILSKMIAASESANYETWYSNKREFLAAIQQSPEQLQIIEKILARANGNTDHLRSITDQQYYRLCSWREADSRINYRRFFTINELICLRMEDKNVFDEYHTWLYKLYKEKLIHGFRIDHIDGLQDPAAYVRDLRELMGESCYIIAEKILEAEEDMPSDWPLQGTSGYEFLSFVNQVLTSRKGAKELLHFYQELVPNMPSYSMLTFNSKKLILENYMSGEWDNVTNMFISFELAGKFDQARVKQALGIFMLSMPVYRIYPGSLPLRGKSLAIIHEAFDKALKEGTDYTIELNYLRSLFTSAPEDDELSARILMFLKRLMQFTGPLTAKGVEDTTFYIYYPLISHNEVGDSPSSLSMTIQRFHERMQMRLTDTPLSLNATATHDTKRGEDARVRINVLSRIPALWKENVSRWLDINRKFRKMTDGKTAPQLNDEYFIYQSMVGGFPEDFQVTEEWKKRVQSFLNKALREAKVNTNWSQPDEQYEKGCQQFIERILGPDHAFLSSFVPFVKMVSEHAMIDTLSQTVIKLTAPGIPDVYQGCELWDLSFVDPDNRRPVDYEKRMEHLFQLVIKEEKGKDAVFEYLRQHRQAGMEKLYVTWKTLNLRKSYPLLFSEGDYIPVTITGKEITAGAYARHRHGNWVLVAFPLGLVKREMDSDGVSLPEQFLVLPENASPRWVHTFTGERFEAANEIPLFALFINFPVAILLGEPAEPKPGL